MNKKLVESLLKIIESLSQEERLLLEQQLVEKVSYPSANELENIAQIGGAFDFLHNEPDLYTVEAGEPIQWH